MGNHQVEGRSEFWSAVGAILPLSLAVVPWGVLTGALAIQAGFNVMQAQCLSLFVFAGAAQISGISMIGGGVAAPSIWGSTLVISSRHLLYSIVFRSHVDGLSFGKRAALAFVLTDEMFVVSEAHTKKAGAFSYAFALVSGFTFYVIWNLATLVGIVAAGRFDQLGSYGLDFAIVATFIAMTFDQLSSHPEILTVLVAGSAAVFLKPFLHESYILVASLLGMAVGYGLSQKKESINDNRGGSRS